MGVVLLCRDLVTDERVAVKLLMRGGTELRPEEAWWFHEEARALASLSHPTIVRARDFGRFADGTPYLVMDAAAGRSLHEWIYLAHTDGLLPWPIVWRTVDKVLGALAHAHARGIIHGDLKPSNVLLDIPTDGGRPTISVLDLGLAWLMQDRVDHRLDGTLASEPMLRWGAGTPGWMAPEQIRFATPHVGPATDLYALGCILFALLSDREPYEGTNEELLQHHRSAPVPEPDKPPGVPADVPAFVMRLMAKRPWDRYEFAGDARRVWRAFKPRGDAMTTPIPRAARVLDPRRPTREEITLPDLHDESREIAEPGAVTTGLLGLRPSPLVARHAERSALLQVVAEVVDAVALLPAEGDVEPPPHRFVLLEGDAGVGKSRLAEWLCEEVHERALMVPLRARYRKMAAPLDGVVGAVTQHYRLERADRDTTEKVLLNIWNVSASDDAGLSWVAATSEWIRPRAPGDSSVGPTGKRFVLDRPEIRALVVRRTLQRIGKHKPIVIWMDDLHDASPSTFDHLVRLHREARRLGLFILATARSEALAADPEAARRLDDLVAEFNGRRVRIAPLDAQETHALLRETLPLDECAVAEAAARSKGNPLFALQLVHAWANNGQLELHEGRYSVPRVALAARADTTADLWEDRLLALPVELRGAALAASALGGDMRRDVLSLQLKELGVDAKRAISAMRRSQLLLASGSDRLRWPHALLQEHLLTRLFAEPNASNVFRAAAHALAGHPLASSRRILRHRVTSLVRAGDLNDAAELLHDAVERQWGSVRDATATLRDLALLDGKLQGRHAATHRRWRAEALRHTGKLELAQREAQAARRAFRSLGDRQSEAHCLRLLGHIASDLAAPAQGRRLVSHGLALFEGIHDERGRALCEVTLGEIEYLLGEHASARIVLGSAVERFRTLGDGIGQAQCMILQAFVEQAGGAPAASRTLLAEARRVFEPLGYRLGLAQCDVATGHALHREGKLTEASAIALAAKQAFHELANPRGEAAAERLLAMAALDMGDASGAESHAHAARALYNKLADPWGDVETRLLLAQIALDRGDAVTARDELIACEAVALMEAEPKQHRHLTLAWLASHEGRHQDAARELDAARASFKEATRTGDHTPQLLARFERLRWPKLAGSRVAEWSKALQPEAQPTRKTTPATLP
jgi:hypothetical protein